MAISNQRETADAAKSLFTFARNKQITWIMEHAVPAGYQAQTDRLCVTNR